MREVDAGEVGQRWLTPGVRGIGAASLLADVGHEVPTSLLPALLTSTLGAPAAALGLIEGFADALAGIARFGGGALADDPGRRRAVAVGGYTVTAVLSGLIGSATAVWQVAALRAGAWAARGIRVPARNALLADVVPPAAYGRAYGFERAMDNLGAILGPLLALALVAAVGVRAAVLLSIAPGIAAAAAVVYAVRHTPRPTPRERTPARLRLRPVLAGRLGRLLAGVGLFEVGNAAATLLILRATQLLTPSVGGTAAARAALLLYAGHNLAATVASVPAGRAADRRGAVVVMVAGVAMLATAYTGFALAGGDLAVLAVCFALAGAGIGCVETAEHTAVATTAPAEVRGSAFGVLAGVQSLGNLIASSVAGLLWTAIAPAAGFTYLAVCMAVAMAVLAGTGIARPLRNPEQAA